MKVIALVAAAAMALSLSTNASAQGLFNSSFGHSGSGGVGNSSFGQSGNTDVNNNSFGQSDGNVNNQNFGKAPLGSGILIMVAAGVGYAVIRRKITDKR